MSENKEVTNEQKANVEKPKNKKDNWFKRFFKAIGAWFKKVFSGTFSELKKVSWPPFTKVIKQTGVVLAVVLFFLVIVTAFDLGLQELVQLVSNAKPQ